MGIWGLLRLALIGFCGWLIYRGIRSWLATSNQRRGRVGPRPGQGAQMIEELVQDPQCETYLPRSEALHVRVQGQDLYFCSEKCRDDYFRSRGK